MTASIGKAEQEFPEVEIPQDSLWRIPFMFIWPVA